MLFYMHIHCKLTNNLIIKDHKLYVICIYKYYNDDFENPQDVCIYKYTIKNDNGNNKKRFMHPEVHHLSRDAYKTLHPKSVYHI